jgi:hypothetical protein
MNRGRVGEDRGSKETDRCPLTDAPAMDSDTTNKEQVGFVYLY